MAKRKALTPEEIGTALGRLANRVDEWKRQRAELIAEGERLASVALDYVRELRGQQAGAPTPEGRRRGGRPRGMKLSEETRAKLRAAWKRRKAQAAGAAARAKKAK